MKTMDKLGRVLVLGVLLAATGMSGAYAADARDNDSPVIRNRGTATFETRPDYIEFWLERVAEGDSYTQSVESVSAFEARLTRELREREFPAAHLEVSAPALTFGERPEARVIARLEFLINKLAKLDEAPVQYAELCDSVRRLAGDLDCVVQGPFLKVANPQAAERTAVARAIENALPLAEAAASTMNTQVTAVESVEIMEVVWDRDPEHRGTQPDLFRTACTARVVVTYAIALGRP